MANYRKLKKHKVCIKCNVSYPYSEDYFYPSSIRINKHVCISCHKKYRKKQKPYTKEQAERRNKTAKILYHSKHKFDPIYLERKRLKDRKSYYRNRENKIAKVHEYQRNKKRMQTLLGYA